MEISIKAFVVVIHISGVVSHGWLSRPPSRESCWRNQIRGCVTNYDDNALNCGGFQRQWEQNNGRCGVCGEDFRAQSSTSGQRRVIVGHYRPGSILQVQLTITAFHKGWHEFRICNMDQRRVLTHSCLEGGLLRMADGGGSRWRGPSGTGRFQTRLQLPANLRCKHCVLQWKWNTGNRWGCDANGGCCIGCGPQEQFYGCADITIW